MSQAPAFYWNAGAFGRFEGCALAVVALAKCRAVKPQVGACFTKCLAVLPWHTACKVPVVKPQVEGMFLASAGRLALWAVPRIYVYNERVCDTYICMMAYVLYSLFNTRERVEFYLLF